MSKLEATFEREMVRTYQEAARLGYHATYFLQKVDELGGVGAAHSLLSSDEPASGFTRLWELGRLDLSVEAVALKPEYASLFSVEERARARQRLADLNYKAPWDRGE